MGKLTLVFLVLFATNLGLRADDNQAGAEATTGPSPGAVDYFDFVSVGVGLPAVSVNWWTRDFGFFDSVSPLTVTFSPKLFQTPVVTREHTDGTKEYTRLSFWSLAAGLFISKPQNGGLLFGVSVEPYIIRFGDYSIGIGVLWLNQDVASLDGHNFNIIIPVTYSLSTGSQSASSQ